ncbi:Uncharacterized membrane protein [Actinomyces ruminicola]|uniref:Uncharacterized membrane protein n=1 Tax=Actinomyces ruminicola TaxID=332524 RepID=A0A1H0EQH8_9ACTO|nr:hypothetical protein [Actinomyces ruminicola]SDN84620.1 Uncharacterized membrane protein [Actinomyces ruminicola]
MSTGTPGYGPPQNNGYPGAGQPYGYGAPQPNAAQPYGYTPPAQPGVSVGDGMSWAWSRIADNAVVLLVGFGLWTILGRLGAEASFTLNGVEYHYGLGIPGGGIISFIATLISPVVLAHVALLTSSGRKADFKDFFTFPNFGQTLLALILSSLAIGLGAIFLIIPGIILYYLFTFVQYAAVEHNLEATAAMRYSMRLLSDNVGVLVPFALVGFLLHLAGAVTVIGWIVTGPLVALMTTYAYVRVQGRDVARYPSQG